MTILLHEYFYNRLCELDEQQETLVRAIRTKKGLIVLCDRLREVEAEKVAVHKVYQDLKHLF